MPTSPSAPGTAVAARLDALRGPVPPRSHDARTIAALTVNPGCSRRAVLDAAGVDKRRLAERIGSPARFGQSPFAITRGLMFEKQIKADGCTQLIELLRTELAFDVPEHAYVDLGAEQSSGGTSGAAAGVVVDRASRHQRTRELFGRVAQGAAVLADHPLLTLEVAGRTAYVEPDVVALRARRTGAGAGSGAATGAGAESLGLEPSLLYIAEVKSFAVIDGQADPTKVGAAATQSAVYVLALRRLFASLGMDPDIVASDVVLVCPKDFSNKPTAHLVDVRRQIAAVSRQLDRLPRIEALVAGLDPTIDFDLAVDRQGATQDAPHPHRSAAELSKSLTMIDARYAPECVTRCELAFHCRSEARAAGSADALGRSVRDALGGIESIDEALALAAGDASAASRLSGGGRGVNGGGGRGGTDEAARLLRAAARAYDEAVDMLPRMPDSVAAGADAPFTAGHASVGTQRSNASGTADDAGVAATATPEAQS
ncbi:hypothetical protein KDL01_05255 [Actinospica durhamensis]|uniref:Secreted protein n=1 Tax=Actinospica durhamensis TaxID=1508375 RepID=A0A941EHF2_9ACTN|nr:hypothetical protein [Actinospica durhamensis]MBR7832655.1 hypothetical protein [Actinospica durhamensis]